MHQPEKPDEPHVTSGETPPNAVKTPSVRKNHLSEVEIIGLILSAAGLILAVLFLPGRAGRVATEIVVVLLLLTVVILYRWWFKQRVHAAILWSIIICLAGLSLHLWMERTKEPFIPPNPSGSLEELNDPWTMWEKNVRQAVEKCNTEHTCIAEAISNKPYPRSNSKNLVDQLNADIRAGSVLMNINDAFVMLAKTIGVKRNFLGDGFALPNNDQSYWKPRVPEYLCINHLEINPSLWTWELPLTDNSKKLKEIIEGTPKNDLENRKAQKDFLNEIQDRMKSSDEAQVVVRFGRFPHHKYKKTLGPPNAKRVFVLRLRDVYELSFRDAANLSGYSIDDNPEFTAEDKLWLWIYLPTDAHDLGLPTWGNIIPNLKDWVSK